MTGNADISFISNEVLTLELMIDITFELSGEKRFNREVELTFETREPRISPLRLIMLPARPPIKYTSLFAVVFSVLNWLTPIDMGTVCVIFPTSSMLYLI